MNSFATNKPYDIGVIHGRFQPFHLDHLYYLQEGFQLCDYMFIGITNADPSHSKFNVSDSKRTLLHANPLTYWERSILIEATLHEAGVLHNRFCIVPFPINKPSLLSYYVPLNAAFFITIYDAWGRHKRDALLSLGLDVIVMWEKEETEKGISGTFVRSQIAQGKVWENLVPPAAVQLIKKYSLDDRIHNLHANIEQIGSI